MSSISSHRNGSSPSSSYLDQIRCHLNDAMTSLTKESLSSSKSAKRKSSKYPIRPHVELTGLGPVTQYLISKKNSNNKEKCLMEVSKNSIRVSFLFKQQSNTTDPIDQSILSKYMKFFQQRAELYTILRRKPVSEYSVSFLILNSHVVQFGINNILQVILDFVSQVDRECSDVKITINARARLVASEFMKEF